MPEEVIINNAGKRFGLALQHRQATRELCDENT